VAGAFPLEHGELLSKCQDFQRGIAATDKEDAALVQRLKQPVPPSEAKLAFTVKLPHSLVRRVRTFAAAKGLSISEVVSRALLALLPRGRGRG